VNELIKICIGLIPVFIFLITLITLDRFRLVKLFPVIQTILIGCIAAIVCYYINSWLIKEYFPNINFYSRYIAPAVEENAKAFFLIYLIKKRRIGFMVDGAIYGFAIGAGFVFIENLYYMYSLEGTNIFMWIIRGLGTAVMHGGTTAIFIIISKSISDRYVSTKIRIFIPGLLVAIVIHSFFNHFLVSPVLMTILQLLILPILIILVFKQSEKILSEWLELSLDADVFLLDSINSGEFSKTKMGNYLHSLKDKFSPKIITDLFCYIRLHLELSVRAKGLLLIKEAGFSVPKDEDLQEKFMELEFLEKSIGPTGKLAISPIFHTSTRDLWQLFMLEK
jgi:RsiW-degrading membrane proteinase PrsW (M82 family)